MKHLIFHIADRETWQRCTAKGEHYRPDTLGFEGFVHFAKKEQVSQVLKSYFSGQQGLLLVEAEIDSTDSKLKWEKSPLSEFSGLFPHYFGGVPLKAVKRILVIEEQISSNFVFQSNLSAYKPAQFNTAAHAPSQIDRPSILGRVFGGIFKK